MDKKLILGVSSLDSSGKTGDAVIRGDLEERVYGNHEFH